MQRIIMPQPGFYKVFTGFLLIQLCHEEIIFIMFLFNQPEPLSILYFPISICEAFSNAYPLTFTLASGCNRKRVEE